MNKNHANACETFLFTIMNLVVHNIAFTGAFSIDRDFVERIL